jgi:hypothetical protein
MVVGGVTTGGLFIGGLLTGGFIGGYIGGPESSARSSSDSTCNRLFFWPCGPIFWRWPRRRFQIMSLALRNMSTCG